MEEPELFADDVRDAFGEMFGQVTDSLKRIQIRIEASLTQAR